MTNVEMNKKIAVLSTLEEMSQLNESESQTGTFTTLQNELVNLGINLTSHIQAFQSAISFSNRQTILQEMKIKILLFNNK